MARPTLDDLADMATFAHVVRARSFTGAAKVLGVSKSAVSKSVSRLEDRLGMALLHRSTRQLSLTEAGQEVYERAERIVAELEAAEQAVENLGEEPRGALRVNAPITFGELFIAPNLPEFMARHPHVRIELALDDHLVDIVAEGWDLAIRIARLTDSALVAKRLAPDRRVVVAAPAYLARHGTPKTPGELIGHNCLRYTLVSARDEWRFHGDDGEFYVPVTGTLQSNHGGLMRLAAIGGIGVALLPEFMIRDDLAEGRLVALLEDYMAPTPFGIYAVWAPNRHQPPKSRAFVDFLAGKLGALCDEIERKRTAG